MSIDINIFNYMYFILTNLHFVRFVLGFFVTEKVHYATVVVYDGQEKEQAYAIECPSIECSTMTHLKKL